MIDLMFETHQLAKRFNNLKMFSYLKSRILHGGVSEKFLADKGTLEVLEKAGHHLFKINDANLVIEYYLKEGKVFIKKFETPYDRGKYERKASET